MLRMIQQEVNLKMTVDLQVEYRTRTTCLQHSCRNSGSDLKDEIVMLGVIWTRGIRATGATDNGAGVAVAWKLCASCKHSD